MPIPFNSKEKNVGAAIAIYIDKNKSPKCRYVHRYNFRTTALDWVIFISVFFFFRTWFVLYKKIQKKRKKNRYNYVCTRKSRLPGF